MLTRVHQGRQGHASHGGSTDAPQETPQSLQAHPEEVVGSSGNFEV